MPNKTSEKVHEISNDVDDIKDNVTSIKDSLKVEIENTYQKMETGLVDYCKKHPLKSLGIALAAGVMLGKIIL